MSYLGVFRGSGFLFVGFWTSQLIFFEVGVQWLKRYLLITKEEITSHHMGNVVDVPETLIGRLPLVFLVGVCLKQK